MVSEITKLRFLGLFSVFFLCISISSTILVYAQIYSNKDQTDILQTIKLEISLLQNKSELFDKSISDLKIKYNILNSNYLEIENQVTQLNLSNQDIKQNSELLNKQIQNRQKEITDLNQQINLLQIQLK